MNKSIISIISIVSVLLNSFSVSAAEVPRESAPCNATNEAIVVVESFIGDILTEVQNGLGYADARAKSNRIFFNAWLNGHLADIDRQAEEMFSRLVKQMVEREGVTEKLKADNQMEWVARMNNINSRVIEIIYNWYVFT